MENYTRVVLHSLSPDWGELTPKPTPAPTPWWGSAPAWIDEGERHSQRVAKVNPTAMKAMPTARFHWPRSFMTGSAERSSEKT